MDRVKVERLLVENFALGLDELHDDLHVVVLVLLPSFVRIVDAALDAQRLQNVPEVLLQGLLAVLVGEEDACLGLARLASP